MKKLTYLSLILLTILNACGTEKGSVSNKKESEENTANIKSEYWPKVVTYEIFIQSFADSNADGIGDFNGATSKLDYLQDLGVEAVWLMPIMESPSYHKYDVTNYKSVHPDYGTMDDFKNFVAEAHKRGISVIIDFIINHTSNLHPWFLESQKGENNPYRAYYNWAEKFQIEDDVSKRQISLDSDNITQWHKSDGNEELYYGFFHGGMPDLNYDNQDMFEEIVETGRFWLQDIGVDGFRLDAAKHIFREHRLEDNHAFWKKFRARMESYKPDVYLVGEVWADANTAAPYSEGLPVLFNFDLAFSILESVNNGKEASAIISGHGHEVSKNVSLIEKFIENNKRFKETNSNFTNGIFLTNHDQNRAMSVLGNDIQKAKLAATIYLTLSGQPYIYYGEEIGMKGLKPDEQIREPMLWNEKEKDSARTTWIESQYSTDANVNSVVSQKNDTTSMFNHYKKLIQIRKSSKVLSFGKTVKSPIEGNDFISYFRVNENDSLLVIHNLSIDEKEIERTQLINGFNQIYFASSSASINLGKILLPARSSIILRPG